MWIKIILLALIVFNVTACGLVIHVKPKKDQKKKEKVMPKLPSNKKSARV
jgi:hypothetical protein